ncbi:MAG: hypothetical protein CMF49_09440 [Legionellales bacterium]|nr:hypothetical protein [Legionellales bacterium]|tara:strand:+ start:324 stop:680 length:357 start_codon:yes stop_codon:yes gene_type:complete
MKNKLYLEFLTKIGELELDKIEEFVKDMTCTRVTKIINHQIACPDQDTLIKQLKEARERAGKFTITPINHCNDKETHQCAVRYLLESEAAGSFTTIAIVNFDLQDKITKIDEIYCQTT